jgi:hypothetical protein
MRIGAVPRQKGRRTPILTQPIDIRGAAHKYGTYYCQFACARKKASHDGERCESMGDDVHSYVFAGAFVSEARPLRGTSSFRARGIILNSTGSRASGSPSTCA